MRRGSVLDAEMTLCERRVDAVEMLCARVSRSRRAHADMEYMQ